MHDDDRLRSVLSDLRDSALPAISPPGVEDVRQSVRRRRAARATMVAVSAAVFALASVLTPPTRTPPPTDQITSTVTTPPASASASPSTAPATSTTTVSASASAGQGAGSVATPAQACIKAGVSKVINNGYVTVRYEPDPSTPCSRVRFFWATYTIDEGVARLYRSTVFHVDATTPEIEFYVDMPPRACSSAFYVVIGDFAIRSSFPAPDVDDTYEKTNGDIQPYQGDEKGYQAHWDVTSPCPPPTTAAPATPTTGPS